jgi:cellulose synthase/poly-beta-1,6-N-acetylglucosamine synthase-like glycosyltransferase
MVAAAVGWWRVRRSPPDAPDEWPPVSVIVPARNEADVIGACLDSLRACRYPDDKLEIIVVDDFSTDGTAEAVRARQPATVGAPAAPPLRLVEMAAHDTANGNHKAAALAHGVDTASGTVLLTTDADCTVPPGWIESMVRRCTPDTPFVAGPVAYEHEDRFLPRLQALELMGLVAYGAGTLGVGMPTFCNSANVAYRRDVTPARNGAPDGAAQDEMLLQYLAYDTERAVTFNPDPEALVTTAPAPSFMDYLHQQARWAQMGLRYPFLRPRLLVLTLWAGHAALFVAGAAALALPAWREPVLLTFLGKMAVDALLTVPVVRRFGQRGLLRSAVPTELFLLFSVPLIGLLSAFGDVEWKGRELD